MQPQAYSRRQLLEDASLTASDLEEIRRCRRDPNRLGFAYQIGFTRLFNRLPNQQPFEIVRELVTYTAIQLDIDPDRISEYAARQHTVSDHQTRIREYLRLRHPGHEELQELASFLFEESFRLEQTAALLAKAKEFLKEKQVLQPAESTILRILSEQRSHARQEIFAKVTASLPRELYSVIDQMLQVPSDQKVSKLQTIKANPSKPSTAAMLSLIDKLSEIEATGVLSVDLSWLNGNYQRALFHYVRKCSADRLKAANSARRHASMACFLWQSYRDAVDQMIDMFDKLLTRVHTQSQQDLDDQILKQRQAVQASLVTLKRLGTVILDPSISDDELRDRVFDQVSKDDLQSQVEALDGWVSGNRTDLFRGVIKRYGYLRQFTPHLLRALEFIQEAHGDPIPCLEALTVLKQMNLDQKRKLPDDAPMGFIPNRLLSVVHADGHPDRHAWECALLVKLRDEIKSGNIAVEHSKRFGRFDGFFIPDSQWDAKRDAFFQRSGLPSNPSDVPGYLKQRLGDAYDRFLDASPSNSYAQADEQGWHLTVDATDKMDDQSQQKLERFKGWLAKHMRRIRLPELLIEVDNELGFTRHFTTPAQQQNRAPGEICTILAAVMAHGCNIGPYTMAQLIQGISYKQIKRVSDWQMTEENQRRALAQLVNAITKLDTSLTWGEGKTSASDGQRFAMPRKVLQQTYSPKFSDFALEFYSFIADNYAPFYSMPIECTDRDAAFVLDGLCYNESDLELEEHYTDTHGYTEINFAAFAMLGRRFCPRIRGIKNQRLYRIDRDRDYQGLSSLVSRADRTINPKEIVQQWDRIGQFYASLETGHTTASIALKRLASFNAKNRFHKANRDLGRIFKTEFILSYMSEPELRARIRRGLLKVEQLHALARDVHYGRRGRINARELHEQINSCSCLTLILASIIYWQAKEISRVINTCDPASHGIDISLLAHISPIEWDNVILYGQYVIDPRLIR